MNWIFFRFILFMSCGLYAYELGVVTMFRNEANYLKEWIEYHHMLGVDHFLLYNDRSEDHWEEVLGPYIQSGLVEVIPWHKDEITPLFPTWQIAAYQDGLRRSKGNTKWLAFIDVDEFFLPKSDATIIDCLNRRFSEASGVYVCWRHFGTNGIRISPGEPIITRLTGCAPHLHSRDASGKSIVKVDDVVVEHVWFPHHLPLKEGAQYYSGSGDPLYFEGTNLQVFPQHTSRYIQLNHYALRDENYYENVRLPKAISREYGEIHLLLSWYASFNAMQDNRMVNFLKKHHPVMYQNFWCDSSNAD